VEKEKQQQQCCGGAACIGSITYSQVAHKIIHERGR
jgi:hypothetical protein